MSILMLHESQTQDFPQNPQDLVLLCPNLIQMARNHDH